MKSAPNLNFDSPLYSPGAAAHLTGIPEKLFSVWAVRSIVPVARHNIGVVGKRRRGQHSLNSILEAKFIFRFVNGLAVSASEASKLAGQILLDWKSGKWKDGSWEWPVWRSLSTNSPFAIFHLVGRIDDCWNIDFCLEKPKAPRFDRKMKNPFAVIPTGSDIWSLYRQSLELWQSAEQMDRIRK
jgi:hypothetical protein